MDIAITRISSKGQVVIPAKMRKNICEGEKLIIIRHKDRIMMKKASKSERNFAGDLEFAKRTEEAWKSYARGEFKKMDAKDFLKEIAKW